MSHARFPAPGAKPVALDWFQLDERQRVLEAALAGEQPGRGRWSLSGRRAAREADVQAEELRGLPESRRGCAILLESTAAGSTREWGALSVIRRGPRNPAFSLEQTLTRHRRALPYGWAAAIGAGLPQLRADAQLGRGGPGLAELHQRLLEQASQAAAELTVTLREHLPGSLRPLPTRVAELQRQTANVTLFVSETQHDEWNARPDIAADPAITLSDIVVRGKGWGLGTTVLTHLCRYADATGSAIVGELEPGPSAPDEHVPIVARWYARHGFTPQATPRSTPAAQASSAARSRTSTRTPSGHRASRSTAPSPPVE